MPEKAKLPLKKDWPEISVVGGDSVFWISIGPYTTKEAALEEFQRLLSDLAEARGENDKPTD